MKKIAIAVLALIASQASAQQAKLDKFSLDREEKFSVLVPGTAVSAPTVPLVEYRTDLLAEFEAIGNEPDVVDQFSDLPSIPAWMRGGRSQLVAQAGYGAPTFADPDCLTRWYFPRFGISEQAQARRRLRLRLCAGVGCVAVAARAGLRARVRKACRADGADLEDTQ